jgi:hypothetical protein
MVKAGAKVAAADKSWAGAEKFRAELEASGKGAALAMDLADDSQLDAAYSTSIDRLQPPNIPNAQACRVELGSTKSPRKSADLRGLIGRVSV